MSEGTDKLLRDSFSKAIPNPTRKQLRKKNGDPRCPPTRVPKLDKMVQDRMSQGAVKLNRSLARLQAHCVDAAGPLATMLELAERGELSAERSVTLARLTLRWLGCVLETHTKEVQISLTLLHPNSPSRSYPDVPVIVTLPPTRY